MLQPQQRQAKRRLARTGFADNTDGLSFAHCHGYAVDGADMVNRPSQHALLDREPDLDVRSFDDDRRISGRRRLGPFRFGCEKPLGIGVGGVREYCRVGPASTIWPSCITQTVSAILRTMPRSWVMNSIAIPNSCCRSFSSFRICAWIVTSSAVVGSSAISRSGSLASAMAIITR